MTTSPPGVFRPPPPVSATTTARWNGQNLNGLDVREILLAGARSQWPVLPADVPSEPDGTLPASWCARPIPAPQTLPDPRADKSRGPKGRRRPLRNRAQLQRRGVCPHAPRRVRNQEPGPLSIAFVNEAEEKANPCRHLVVQRRGRWELANEGLRELELLTY